MTDIPPGYRLYADVLARLGPLKETGEGLTFQCLFPDRHRHGDRTPSCRAWVALDGSLMARCLGCGASWEEIVEAAGTRKSDWWPNKGKKTVADAPPPKPKHAATYQYRTRDGKLAYEKLRYDYPLAPGEEKPRKTFRQRRPLPADWRGRLKVPKDVQAWAWGLVGGRYGREQRTPPVWDFRRPVSDGHQETIDLPDADPLLYRLPELVAALPDVPVFVVEGEGDADLLAGLGFVATCGHAGAGVWLLHWSAEFKGRRVVVVPDHNTVGYQHADAVAGSVLRAGAKSVRLLQWEADGPFFPGDGGGVGNWIAKELAGSEPAAVKAAVVGLCKNFPEYTRPVEVAARSAEVAA